MSRRKPVQRVVVVPREAGEDHEAAVLRKAAERALAAVAGQSSEGGSPSNPFTAGYAAGYARHEALRHGVDAEVTTELMRRLLRSLAAGAAPALADELTALRFLTRPDGVSLRSRLQVGDAKADAGYLVGHLEALCGTSRLLAAALHVGGAVDVIAYLTDCDHAADRLQTHQPTASLRFTAAERDVVRSAFRL